MTEDKQLTYAVYALAASLVLLAGLSLASAVLKIMTFVN